MLTSEEPHFLDRNERPSCVSSRSSSRVCSYLSLALLVGLGGFAIFGWWRADPIGALAKLHVVRTDRGAIQVLRRHCPSRPAVSKLRSSCQAVHVYRQNIGASSTTGSPA
jgi:hypothetical protein